MRELLAFDERIDELALMAIYQELIFEDKPGLVSMKSNGAHNDMDYTIMKKGAGSLKGYFKTCFNEGFFRQDFKSLREIGKEYDYKMYEATGGVNTHQGIIFSLGIFVYLIGKSCRRLEGYPNLFGIEALKKSVKENILNDEALLEVFKEGKEGARGEIACFYSSSFNSLKYDFENRIYAILAAGDFKDTNIVRRKGDKIHNQFKGLAKEVIQAQGAEKERAKTRIKEFALKKHISPGGAADILILSIFIEDFLDYFSSYFEEYEEKRLRFKEHLYRLSQRDSMVYSLVFPGLIKDLSVFRNFYKEKMKNIFYLSKSKAHFYKFGYYSYANLEGLSLEMLKLIKKEMVEFEKIGLIDIDIYHEGKALGRRELGLEERTCLLCEQKAKDCYVNRTHRQSEIIDAAIKKIMVN